MQPSYLSSYHPQKSISLKHDSILRKVSCTNVRLHQREASAMAFYMYSFFLSINKQASKTKSLLSVSPSLPRYRHVTHSARIYRYYISNPPKKAGTLVHPPSSIFIFILSLSPLFSSHSVITTVSILIPVQCLSPITLSSDGLVHQALPPFSGAGRSKSEQSPGADTVQSRRCRSPDLSDVLRNPPSTAQRSRVRRAPPTPLIILAPLSR